MTTTTTEELSPFAKAVKARFAARPVHRFQVDGYFGLGDKPIPEVGVVVPTKRREVAALDTAHALAKEMCGQAEARSDADVLVDLKAACIAYEACRRVDDPRYSAFPSPRWMYEHMTGDQIGALVNLVNQVRVKEAPAPLDVTDEQVEAWAVVCASQGDTGLPSAQLAAVPREYLEFLVVALASKLATERARLADATKALGS